ncbi:Gfo/Idh/MocA family protein [Sedimenticola selenatireducens]|uniref:Gfo/Idh/MocA family oxidoreductase n=1 Tax=Sedimenticola selenatireducens TaxID=191960 RepID=A0A558DVW8_9GAMM|nr:Gfo/Idh/MocA family oxidoreductase [Sedimenticola selenatireducens]TVO77887.1 Gfo/Idh/MocA family oxidoreductase [Sedimenticola selenatireducens]TVT65192.1 MAG: Gfo/Idh/MocA family oxidoreductase [Sedimenticola selenatireducens]
MDRKLRIATVGTGYFSQFQYAAWQRLAEQGRVELVAICNRTVTEAEQFIQRYGAKEAFNDFETMLNRTQPDLVDIITPPVTHPDYVRLAVDHGIPAICQKPFTPSLAEATDLVNYIDQQNAQVVIHENFRFQPWYAELHRQLSAGAIGEPYQVAFRLRPGDGQGAEAYLDRQPYFQQMERFLVHETAIHLIDTFRYLFGEVSAVYASLSKLNPVIAGEDAGLIIFDFEGGTRGLFDGNRLVDHKAENRRLTMGEMCIEGAEGTLMLDGDGAIHLRKHSSNEWIQIEYHWENRDFGGDCVYRLQKHVVDHLQHGSAITNSAQAYLRNLYIEEAIYKSAATGMKVALPITVES